MVEPDNSLPRWLSRLTDEIKPKSPDTVKSRKILAMYAVMAMTTIVLAIFGAIAFNQGSLVHGTFVSLTSALYAANFFYFYIYRQYERTVIFGTSCAGVLFVYLFASGAANNSTFLWCYPFPIATIYFMGARKGLIATALLLCAITIAWLMGGNVSWITSYDSDLMLRFFPSLTAVSVFSYLFQRNSERNQTQFADSHDTLEQMVKTRTEELSKTNQALREEMSEREAAQAAVESSQKTLVTTLEGIDGEVYVADVKTYEVLFMNRRMMRRLGGDFTGERCFNAFRKRTAPCSDCSNEYLLDANNQPTEGKVWDEYNPTLDRWYRNHDRAIRWVDGRMARLEFATDITIQKRMEEKLLQSQKMEAIGTLAGGVAHDFNNILAAILGYTELSLMEESLEPRTKEHLNNVLTAALRAKDLVKQILMFSRKGEGKKELLQIHLVVEEAVKLMRPTIPATININMEINRNTGTVRADATQLHQIVMNLGVNAYHAMRKTGGELNICLEPVDVDNVTASMYPGLGEGYFALLTVSDTGNGIEPLAMSRIFEPFFTTRDTGEGTGMGLSVVHGIVHSHGGAIGVESTLGEGATFKVFLPLIKDEAEMVQQAATSPRSGDEHVLVVDDEPALGDMLHDSLELLGYRVTTFTSSQEALESFAAAPETFDLMITDHTMPGMTGDKLAEEVMKIDPDFPVIICTGFSENMDEPKAAALGVKAMLMKPLELPRLYAIIRQILDEAK